MFATVHMLAGVAIATQEKNLLMVFLLGLISHFLLDALPHRDLKHKLQEKLEKEQKITIALDLSICFLTFIYLNYYLNHYTLSLAKSWPFVFAAAGALLPDVINGLRCFFPRIKQNVWYNRYTEFHEKIQWWTTGWWGYFGAQLIVTLVALGVILK